MAFNLPELARQRRIRRAITLRPIQTSKAQATDLATILLRPLAVWQAAIPQIMAGYTPSSLTQDSPADMTSAIDRGANEVERLIVTITAQLRTWALRTEGWHRGKWTSAVLAGTGVDLSTVLTALPVEETMDAWLQRNVALVRDVTEQTRGRISDIVFREFQAGTPPRDVGRQIADAVGLGRQRARRIAADQAVKISSQLDRERQAEAGIDQIKWRHSGKTHARPEHKARDGKVYDLKTGKRVDGGETIPRDDRAGMAPYCGCVEQAYIPLMDEL